MHCLLHNNEQHMVLLVLLVECELGELDGIMAKAWKVDKALRGVHLGITPESDLVSSISISLEQHAYVSSNIFPFTLS